MAVPFVRNLADAVIAGLKARVAKYRRSLRGDAAMPAPARRRLELVMVSVGAPSSFRREEIYDDDGER